MEQWLGTGDPHKILKPFIHLLFDYALKVTQGKAISLAAVKVGEVLVTGLCGLG